MRKGFTLIELLIVVAIIAILAAIAVPNFLEAQTRSKVARCKSDMRTMALGCQAYAVDYNKHPYDDPEWDYLLGVNHTGDAMVVITTPVAYINNLLPDPFRISARQKNPDGLFSSPGGTFNYKASHIETYESGGWRRRLYEKGYLFMLFSVGPSRERESLDFPGKWVQPQGIILGERGLEIYDSTNGTNSHGLIIRTNKNEYTGADYIQDY